MNLWRYEGNDDMDDNELFWWRYKVVCTFILIFFCYLLCD